MSHVVSKFRPAHTIPKGWTDVDAEQGATTVGVAGSSTHVTAASIAEAALPIGVGYSVQSSSLYGIGG